MTSLLAVTGDALLTAFAVAASAVPVAHVAGVALCWPARTPRPQRRLPPGPAIELQFLLGGGSRHLVLQCLSLVGGRAWRVRGGRGL